MKAGFGLLILGVICVAAAFLVNDSVADKILTFGAGWNLALGSAVITIEKMGLL